MAFKWPFKRVFHYMVFYSTYSKRKGVGCGRCLINGPKIRSNKCFIDVENDIKKIDCEFEKVILSNFIRLKTEWVWQWRF